MRLWICDCIYCYGSRKFSISTNLDLRCQELVKITHALIIKDYAAPSFDPNIYSNLTCKQMFTLDSNMHLGVLGYIKVKREIFHLKKLIFICLGLICRGTHCFFTKSSTQSSLVVKISWRFEDLVPDGENFKAIGKNLKVVYVVRLDSYDKTCNIEKNIYHSSLKRQLFLFSDPVNHIIEGKLNFGDISKAKKSCINWVLTKIALMDFRQPLIEARLALKFLRGVYNLFVGNSMFIHPNKTMKNL